MATLDPEGIIPGQIWKNIENGRVYVIHEDSRPHDSGFVQCKSLDDSTIAIFTLERWSSNFVPDER